jgi:hypothetical protein
MRYWWVNQNQTYRQEIGGQYLWSPKRRANGTRNPFYEFMREVAPGDLVFSFADTLIRAFGVARSFAYEAPKPLEFGSAGRNWEAIGWRVDVEFHPAALPFRPMDWIEADPDVPTTEKQALVLARRGQGKFRERVAALEQSCRVTRVDRPEHLRASHCKPWRDCTNAERLDGDNGLMLTPSIDHLFDRGFISFEDGGVLLVSPVAHRPSLQRMGVDVEKKLNVGRFTAQQGRYLEFHRDAVFLRSAVAL